MGLLSPWFLGGVLAVGLPIYLHLLKQHKSQPFKFSSLMFVEKRTQTSVKHRRLKYLALLALRCLLLIVLALAFANPFINRPPGTVAQGRKYVVVAVDQSFSMRAQNRLEKAKQDAVNSLSQLKPGDNAQVIAFGRKASLVSEPTADRKVAEAAIRGIQQSDEYSSFGELSAATRNIATNVNGPVEVHVFSDMQQTSMPVPFGELNQPTNVKVVLHPQGLNTEKNYFVESVSAPGSVYKADRIKVQATVGGAHTDETEAEVSLRLNGKTLESKRVKVPAGARSSVDLYIPEVPHGLNRGEVAVSLNDAMADDNRMVFSIERKEPGRVLFLHEARGQRAALYYKAALESGSQGALAVDTMTPEQAGNVDLKKYSLVVWSDLGNPGAVSENVRRFVTGGGSLFIALGPVAGTRTEVPLFGERILASQYETRSGERFQTASYVDASHRALWRVNDFDGVKFYQSVQVEPGKSRVLARLSNGTPLVMEKRLGEGNVMVFTSTFDNISNDLPIRASFVPFVDSSAQYLAGIEPQGSNPAVGSVVELRASREQAGAVEVIGPDGKRELSLSEAANAQALELKREGFYEIRKANGRHELVAAHADRRESVLAAAPAETLSLWSNLGQGTGSPTTGKPGENKPEQLKLWWYFVLALLALAIAESWLASRYLSSEPELAEIRRKEAA